MILLMVLEGLEERVEEKEYSNGREEATLPAL